MKRRVLILCTGNSCRSQMAEGFWRHLGGDAWEVHSAGLSPMGVNPLAVEVMSELGIDISGHSSDSLERFLDQAFDLLITVCSNAEARCPVFPGARQREHWPYDDPFGVVGTREEVLAAFRRVRDEIGARIRAYLDMSPP
jgi:arsenate reductase